MKKTISLILTLSLALVLFAACNKKKDEEETFLSMNSVENISKVDDNSEREQTDSLPKITIETPVTISNNSMYAINGKDQFIRLIMVEGKYFEDWTPGAFEGRMWEGYYVIELIDQLGEVVAKTDLRDVFRERLLFTYFFQLEFDDYNNDGDLDFTIGQHGSSNGNDFKLFTIREDGKVEQLLIKEYPSLFISDSSYSTKLVKLDETTFTKSYYDNAVGKLFEDTFKWDGEQFVHMASREVAN